MSGSLEILILTHDRPESALKTIENLQSLDWGIKPRIVLSDNPSSESRYVQNVPPEIIHRRRFPFLSVAQHHNLALSEVESDWLILTHDDDELLDYFAESFKLLRSSSYDIITGYSRILDTSVGEIIDDSYNRRLLESGVLTGDTIPRSQLQRVLFNHGMIYPASAICVRSIKILEALPLDVHTNAAIDYEYAMKISKNAKLKFLIKGPIMNYVIHGANSISDRNLAFTLPGESLRVKINALTAGAFPVSYKIKSIISREFMRAKLLLWEKNLEDIYQETVKTIQFSEFSLGVKLIQPWARVGLPFGRIGKILRNYATRRRVRLDRIL